MSRSRPEEELEANLVFHQREWRIQRIGWVLVVLFLALALAGLFGGGPLSHAHVDGPTGRIDYERFVRDGTSTQLVVTPGGGVRHGVSHVEISAAYLEAFRIERITPEPTAVRMTTDRLVYEFAGAAPGASVSFHIHPERPGRHAGRVRIDAGAPLEIRQLTYP